MTEFPPGSKPLPYHFPRRNRIISGLSLGVLVVESALPSGSLITAHSAVEQGREVFALPWSIAHMGGAGCLRLLRDGAKMVLGIEDILEELGSLYGLQLELSAAALAAPSREPSARPSAAPSSQRSLERATRGPDSTDEDESILLSLIGFEVCSLDQLVTVSGLPVGQVMAELSALELMGRVCRCPGGYICSR